MATIRLALANLPYATSPDDSVRVAARAVGEAARAGAAIVCFPECYVPGYRAANKKVPPPDAAWLESAWAQVAAAARAAGIVVVLGTERVRERLPIATALVIGADGSRLGWQDKVQIDPSEDALYEPGTDRRVFEAAGVTFGVVICHEGWRYPETVRAAARLGAQVVFHQAFHEAEPGGYRPTTFADPRNTFHEKAALCRAAENTVWFATVNYASVGSPATSAVIRPDGTLVAWQPYGAPGLLVQDVELDEATRLLALRRKAYA